MPDYSYLVVHIPTGKLGRGVSVWKALDQALGKKECMKLHAAQPRSGYAWGKYETRTVGSTSGARRTVQSIKDTYELAPVYTHARTQLPNKEPELLLAVYRSVHPDTLLKLPDNAHTESQADRPKVNKKSRRG